MKARPVKNGKYIASYNLSIGAKEARDAGFVASDGERFELSKTIDAKNKRIVIEVKEDKEGAE